MQGQDLPGVLESVALRSLGPSGGPATIADVRSSLADGTLVRSWPMRGTLHVVPGEDLGWMVKLAAGRSRPTYAAKLAVLGADDDVVDLARRVALDELAGSRVRTRTQLYERWKTEGVDTANKLSFWLLYLLVIDGEVCQVDATRDGEIVHGFVHTGRWLDAHGITPRAPSRDEAVAEWLERFLRSHGPARIDDFRRWTTLPLRDLRPALEAVSERLEAVCLDGDTYWMDPAAPDLLTAAGRSADAVLLLPGFDEYLLGYGDRTHAVAQEHAHAIVPGNNGVFRRTVVHRGRVIGTWKTVGAGVRRRLETTPFASLSGVQSTGIERAFRRYPR